MKKLSFILIAVVMLSFCACGEKHDFGNVDFGMTKAEVKEAEKKSQNLIEPTEVSLKCETKIGSVLGELTYLFHDEKLMAIMFRSESSSDFEKDYESLKKYLIKLYDKPDEEEEGACFWEAVILRRFDNASEVGFAVLAPVDEY